MFIGIGEKPLEIGERAPEFSLRSASGGSVSLKEFSGKRVFLFFFRGTWCPNCANHMREIQKEFSRLQDLNVNVLGICCQGLEPMAVFLKKEGLSFPFLSDQDRQVAKAYGVYTYLSWDSINIARPSFFYIDEKGIIRFRYIGEHQWDRPNMEELNKLVQKQSQM